MPLEFFDQIERPVAPRQPRRKGSCVRRGCCLGLVFVVASVGIAATVIVAKTGIIYIPVISDWFYRHPVPPREVVGDETATITPTVSGESYTIEVTEEQLTGLVRNWITHTDAVALADSAQVLIDPTGITIYGFLLEPIRANITIALTVEAVAGAPVVKIKNISVGTVPLLPSMIASVEQKFGPELQDQLAALTLTKGTVDTITFLSGTMRVQGTITQTP